jgi:hypothetical protein
MENKKACGKENQEHPPTCKECGHEKEFFYLYKIKAKYKHIRLRTYLVGLKLPIHLPNISLSNSKEWELSLVRKNNPDYEKSFAVALPIEKKHVDYRLIREGLKELI